MNPFSGRRFQSRKSSNPKNHQSQTPKGPMILREKRLGSLADSDPKIELETIKIQLECWVGSLIL